MTGIEDMREGHARWRTRGAVWEIEDVRELKYYVVVGHVW